MTQQKARVVRLLGDGRAEVTVTRQTACGHDCSKCGGGCSELTAREDVTVTAVNPIHAAVGDLVTVETATSGILGAAALVYLAPFALFFLGYFLTRGLLHAGEGICLAVGGAGFALGIFLAVLLDRRVRRNRSLVFRITAIEQAA